MLSPHMGVFGSGRDMVVSWLVRIPIFMVMGVTVLTTALVVLKRGRARRQVESGPRSRRGSGRLPGRLRHSLMRSGRRLPRTDRRSSSARSSAWFIPAAALVAGYVFYLHTPRGA